MANKTFIPALRARVGDWDYYICTMKYAEVARQVQFAYELNGNAELNSMIQRGISTRTDEIVKYLMNNEHRFLGALIIACWGGSPEYVPLEMADPENVLEGIDQGFGVLTFDGTQSYFALDGQHRLRAIKDALKKDPSLGSEDIAVLIVSHYESESGRERTRRLFTNINRNAKVTTAAENIALDEDDGYSVLTRRFLTDHPFLAKDKVVKVFTFVGDEGERRLAGKQIAATDKYAFTTIVVLRALLQDLWFESTTLDLKDRPAAEVLDEAYEALAERFDALLKACGDIVGRMDSATSARDVRYPKGQEGEGHPLMRPIVQQAVVRVVRQIVNQKALTFEEVMSRLSELDWRLEAAPWTAVYNVATKKMITAKENVGLLVDLLYVHLAPPSAQAVKRARRSFKEITHATYPVSEETLAARVDSSRPADGGDGVVNTDDLSEEPNSFEATGTPPA
ncbi:DNA sulfur modification protein DndB [Geodermatophilus sp. SYSU D01106]